MKNKHHENKEKNPLQGLDDIKLKRFEDLEAEEFDDIKLEDFKKSRLKEFNNVELKAFKEFLEDSKTDIYIENLKLELISDSALKKIIKNLQSIGIDGRGPLEFLKILKKIK